MQTILKRVFSVLLCALLLAGLAANTFAASSYDPEAICSLTVDFATGSSPISGASFSLYRVADVNSNVIFTLTEKFAQSAVQLNGIKSNEVWLDTARNLKNYVTEYSVSSDTGAKLTDAAGQAVFENLPAGLYLIVGERITVGSIRYTPTPVLICLPNEIDGEWVSDVTSITKFTATDVPVPPPTPPIPPIEDDTEHKVLKVWDDAGFESERPESITVHLLRDGKLYSTVTLTAEKNWRYEWIGLPRVDSKGFSYEWTVSEEPIEGYTTLVTESGITSVITNTRGEKAEEPAPVEQEPEPELPNTGMLWWPVPVLLMAGLMLLIVGIVVGKKSKA